MTDRAMDDVRAAAERLRRTSTPDGYRWAAFQESCPDFCRDVLLIVNAYLAVAPADDDRAVSAAPDWIQQSVPDSDFNAPLSDQSDAAAMDVAMNESSERIPYDHVREELGLTHTPAAEMRDAGESEAVS